MAPAKKRTPSKKSAKRNSTSKKSSKGGKKDASKNPVKRAEKAASGLPSWAKWLILAIIVIAIVLGLVFGLMGGGNPIVVQFGETCVPLSLWSAPASDLTIATTTPQSYIDHLDSLEGVTFMSRPTTTADPPQTSFVGMTALDSKAKSQKLFDAYMSGLSDTKLTIMLGAEVDGNTHVNFAKLKAKLTDVKTSTPTDGTYLFGASSDQGFAASPKFCTPSGGSGSGTPAPVGSLIPPPSWWPTGPAASAAP